MFDAAAEPVIAEPDWKALYLSIRRCNAVYDSARDLHRAFAGLGSSDIRHYVTGAAQAVLHRAPSGRLTLTDCGTHFTMGPLRERLGDIAEDARFNPYHIDANCAYAAGPLARAKEIWRWAIPLIHDMTTGGEQVDIEGHSLGADAACATPVFLPAAQIGTITAWEPAKTANAAYWRAYAQSFARLTTVYHGRSPFFHYPPDRLSQGLCHHRGPLLWLRAGTWSLTALDRIAPGDILAWRDHDPSVIAAAVKALMDGGGRCNP